MLGELLGESSGRITGLRVLSADGGNSKVEASIQGQGTVLGMTITDIGTYWQVFRPNGAVCAEGNVLLTTDDGDLAPWKGFSVGRFIGSGMALTAGAAGAFHGATGQLDHLNQVATVVEYQLDSEGNYRWQLWEWLGPDTG
jgi:hypothetical protein